jgi:hypothetical protein
MIDLDTKTGNILIIKLVTGDQLIGKVKNLPEAKTIQLELPLYFYMEYESDTNYNLVFNSYMTGAHGTTCFISKHQLITVYPPMPEVLAAYLDVFNSELEENQGDLEDDEGFDYRAGNVKS